MPGSPGSAPCSDATRSLRRSKCCGSIRRVARGVLRQLAADPGDDRRRRGGRRAGQDPARGAARRDGRSRRGSFPPLLRQRRFDPAVRHARRRLSRADRRPRGRARACGRTSEAALDWIEQLRRSRRRRLRGIRPPHPRRPRQPGLEGQPRRRFPRGRVARRRRRSRIAEVQAYVYGAWRAASDIARAACRSTTRRSPSTARRRRSAARFDQQFFDEALGTYVLALDGDKRPCRVRASNAGHALFTGIALPERARAVVATLMASSSFCGWGVRTVASTEARYNPMSYHNGSVWPHDNALIAAGLRPLWISPRGGEGVRGPVQRFDLCRPQALAGAPLRIPAQAGPRPDVLSGRLRAAGLGRGRAAVAHPVVPGADVSTRPGRGSRFPSRSCPPSSTRSSCRA